MRISTILRQYRKYFLLFLSIALYSNLILTAIRSAEKTTMILFLTIASLLPVPVVILFLAKRISSEEESDPYEGALDRFPQEIEEGRPFK